MQARVLAGLVLLAAAGCYDRDFDRGRAERDATSPCPSPLPTAVADATLPADIPAGLVDAELFRRDGDSYVAHVAGDDPHVVRDAVLAEFETRRFTVRPHEPNGPMTGFSFQRGVRWGSVDVRPFCSGRLRVTWHVTDCPGCELPG